MLRRKLKIRDTLEITGPAVVIVEKIQDRTVTLVIDAPGTTKITHVNGNLKISLEESKDSP